MYDTVSMNQVFFGMYDGITIVLLVVAPPKNTFNVTFLEASVDTNNLMPLEPEPVSFLTNLASIALAVTVVVGRYIHIVIVR